MEGPIKILWTGGWDSTYRVLELVLVERAVVQPYYVIDPKRRSTGQEEAAMERIRERVLARDASARERLLPLVVASRDDFPPDEEISRHIASLASRMRVGTQYEWLSLFCRAWGLDDLELCVEADRGGNGPLKVLLIQHLEGAGHERRLPEPLGAPELMPFRFFRFPILHLTKEDIKERARELGFLDLLDDTWFCHKPKKGLPCGRCRPCELVFREGMAERMPASSRVRHYWWKLRRTLRPEKKAQAPAGRNASAA
ncbi:MAG: 7-cyano-7-deazaguanine synthase [Myxococcota bacterium]|nr:7-cyano-7-deazaguanine synthase [Myxococcota bacterium]